MSLIAINMHVPLSDIEIFPEHDVQDALKVGIKCFQVQDGKMSLIVL